MIQTIQKKLYSLQDVKYKHFSSKLIPTVAPDTVIGVRVPQLRKLANELNEDKNIDKFLTALPHKYFEENNLHAFIICEIKDFDKCITALNRFLPYVDNWATCDSMRPKCFKNNTDMLSVQIQNWLSSNDVYTVRFGILMLMVYFLDDKFDKKYLDHISNIKSDEYYINMMIAWYFATALAKQWDSALPYIEQRRLPIWVHNRTIQKAVESYRISEKHKNYLKSLKISLRDK